MWSYPPRKILVAVDFGDASSAAARVAGELARTFDAALTVLHAESFEAPPYFTRDQITAIEKQRRSARHEAERYLTRFCEPLTRWPVTPAVSQAPAADAILDLAVSHDLIVMGTHGRRGPVRWWAGSVAERVAREAEIPVLVVRSDSADRTDLFSRISVAEGTAAFSGSARRYAAGLTEAFGGTLTTESSDVCSSGLHQATLVILPQTVGGWPHMFAGPAARALRECRRALLFVPIT